MGVPPPVWLVQLLALLQAARRLLRSRRGPSAEWPGTWSVIALSVETALSERWLAECAMDQYGTVVIVYLLAEFACVGRGGALAEQGREQQGGREE